MEKVPAQEPHAARIAPAHAPRMPRVAPAPTSRRPNALTLPGEAVKRLNELAERLEKGEITGEEFANAVQEAKAAHSQPAAPPRQRTPPRVYTQAAKPTGAPEASSKPKKGGQSPPKRRKFRPATREAVLEAGLSIQDQETRVLFFTLYLSAARISEGLMLKAGDVEIKPANDKRPVSIVFRLKTLKRRDSTPHVASAVKVPPYERMIQEVEDWVSKFEPDDALFILHRTGVNNRFARVILQVSPLDSPDQTLPKKLNPHFLRHCRMSHLRQYHRFDLDELKAFTGRRTYPFEYIHVEEERLAERQAEAT